MCGRLNYSRYDTRDAAVNWAEECIERLIANGFVAGIAAPCVCFRAKRKLRAYVHGGDFVVIGMPEHLTWLRNKMEEQYEFTVETVGPEKGQCKEVRVLNRVLRWNDKIGVEYEADSRHVEVVLK